MKRRDITELPKESNEEYVIFEVESWQMLNEVIKPVGYGISVYTITTLNTLKQAKELPEIFMKTKEEVTLWRMLRRVSDRVQFDLDARYLDQATKIERYRVKDITFKVDHEQRRMVAYPGNNSLVIDLDDILHQPSGVFKEIVKIIE